MDIPDIIKKARNALRGEKPEELDGIHFTGASDDAQITPQQGDGARQDAQQSAISYDPPKKSMLGFIIVNPGKFFRVLRQSIENVSSDQWLTRASLGIFVSTVVLVITTILLGGAVQRSVVAIQKSINISVYFNPGVLESKILNIRDDVTQSGPREIEQIEFISQEVALETFTAFIEGNQDVLDALEVIEGNPLPDALVITADTVDDYAMISAYFQEEYGEYISSVTYESNKARIENIQSRMKTVQRVTFFLNVLLIAIGCIVIFDMIAAGVSAYRRKFQAMRLVGAPDDDTELPEEFEGRIYGTVGATVTGVVFFLVMLLADPYLRFILSPRNLLNVITSKWTILLVIIIVLVIGGILAYRYRYALQGKDSR